MSAVSKIPPLRFKGFEGSWEEKRLSVYLKVSGEQNEDNRFGVNDVLSVSGEAGVVNQIEFQGRSFAGASVSGYHVLHKGQVTYTKSPLKANPYGIIKANKRKDGIVSALYGVYDCVEGTCADFVQCYFDKGSRLNNYLRPLVCKGAKNTLLISDEEALQGDVVFPANAEQEQIAQCCRSLDALIADRESAVEKLQALKKAMLEKMFPRAGAKVPEVRFKGCEGEWKERRLGDSVRFAKGKGYSKSDIQEEGTPLFLYGRMYTDYQIEVDRVDTFCVQRNGSVLSVGNEVVCPASGETAEDIACASAVKEKGIVLGGDLNILVPHANSGLDPAFLAMSLTYGPGRAKIVERAQGKTVVHIHNSDLEDVVVLSPSLPEQQKIGAYFQSLDTLISARQEEVGKLKEVKKALLDRMFVGE